MSSIFPFIVTVMGGVFGSILSHYIIKWLDGNDGSGG